MINFRSRDQFLISWGFKMDITNEHILNGLETYSVINF